MLKQFSEDVNKGLSANPKFLSSRYFYDKKGDELFVQIMNMPEYYLTKAEHEIFKEQSDQIIESLGVKKDTYFELIELGAGDGTKTKELLKALLNEGYQFDYLPIDISQNALDQLEGSLEKEYPDLSVKTKQGDYFGVLESIKDSKAPKVVLFLGSNLGNLLDTEAHDFIYKLGSSLNSGDKLFVGVDAIKSDKIVIPAYSDAQGITASFNLNLFERMNRELGADFDLDSFEHKAEYTEDEGVARSYLISSVAQDVSIKSIDKTFRFEEGERIHTEISRKYNDEILNKILKDTDFEILGKLTDSKNYFTDYILNRN